MTPEIKQISLKEITTLPELEAYLPPLDDIAQDKLKTEIKEQGIREPLVLGVLDGKKLVLDGHNRLTIAKKLKYETVPVVFHVIQDITDAKIFMVNNQLGKRNLSTKERVLIALQLEPELKAQALARQKKGKADLEQKSDTGRVSEQLAKIAGKSRDTIAKIKLIKDKGIPELLKVADAELSINTASEIASMPKEAQAGAIIEALKKPVVEKPEDRHNFTCGSARVDGNKVVVEIDTTLASVELTAETEAENIKLLRERADYFAGIANDLRQTAKLIKTPKEPKPKREKREKKDKGTKKKLTALQKKAKEFLKMLPDTLTQAEIQTLQENIENLPVRKQQEAIKQFLASKQA